MNPRTWKLSDIYPSIDDENISSDKKKCEDLVSKFKDGFEGNLTPQNLKDAIRIYENILIILEKLSAFSFLYLQTRLNNQDALSFFQGISEWITSIQSELVFFDIEITNLDMGEILVEFEGDDEFKRYTSWIENCFRFKDHLLSKEGEFVASQKSMTSRYPWIRLYDEISAMMTFDFKGEKKSLSEIVEIANHSDDSDERRDASLSLSSGLQNHAFYIKSIYNNIILDTSIDNRLRKFSYAEESRHLSNNIDRQSVDYLVEAVISGYKKTSHKYYEIKSRLLGRERIEYWDRNAPIKLSKYLDRKYTYEEACDIVLEGYGSFCPEFKDIAKEFIDNDWIDVYPCDGKTSGAFSHHCCSEIHPYILLNFFGSMRDVSTLAHELGHGIHQRLSNRNGPILSDTPITLSEVASLFGEKLIFEELLKKTSNNLERIDLLCSKLDDTINSVIRQIAFFEFERKCHNIRQNGELSIEDISRIWMETQRDALGDFVNIDERLSNYWCYISHFFHCPFYVYAYAFGEIFVNALYSKYKTMGHDFVGYYRNMLSRGGIDRYDVASRVFGLNPLDSDFWFDGVKTIENQVCELEDLCCGLLSS